MNSEKVSICIPVFNGKKYITQAIDSALDQDYENIEVIVCDNCSTDGTWELALKYHNNDKVILHRNKSNIGMYANFNHAAKIASGDFIKFLCADDTLAKSAVHKMVNMFHRDSRISVVKIYAHDINTEGAIISSEKFRNSGIAKGKSLFKQSMLTLSNKFLDSPSHLMFYKNDFLAINCFPTTDSYHGWGNDMVTFLQLSKNSLVGFIPEHLLHRRIHEAQYTARIYSSFSLLFRANLNTINMLKERKAIGPMTRCYLLSMITLITPLAFLIKRLWRSKFKA